jgi:hypothetical protein
MSVFTHGVAKKGKPALKNRNQVFPVYAGSKELRREFGHAVWGCQANGEGMR